MKVTLHKVAEQANVSIATVSRALNGLPVSQASKARVEKAASELGYIANDAARALRSERTMTMGLLFFDLSNTLGIDLLDALSESIEDAGYSLLISTARGDADRYDLLMRRFLERRADALFCIRPKGQGTFLDRYVEASIPVIALFGASGPFARLPTVNPSLVEGGNALAQHLKDSGHRRVAVLEGQSGYAQRAITHALTGHGLRVLQVEVSQSGSTRDSLADLMARKQRPTAVIAPDPAVRGLVSACAALQIDVPRELSVVAICDRSAEGYFRKRDVSSITIDPHRMGRAAGSAMLAWLEGVQPAQNVRVQTATFNPRGSSDAVHS